jgi:hypothetical protein
MIIYQVEGDPDFDGPRFMYDNLTNNLFIKIQTKKIGNS